MIRHFYGNKTKSRPFFLGRLMICQLHLLNMYSREKVDGAYEGRIDKDNLTLIKRTLKFSESDYFLICGPEEMIHNCKETLNFFGLSDDKILFELFTTYFW